ncbi:hypothetical protein L6164_030392 [Bauhinia variegata]|uniref:Uncharacterized protein n=1 Tax=Bauhinia variegata TaxID=167791 RepID=A0ACB9LCI1_BAUVA|nr:hypothetical protein L6164_030392 [Bauhinia variegata]
MASTQPNNLFFPHFPPPAPHQFVPPPPPQHGHPPPPPPFHPFSPPPPPPPPSHPFAPPPHSPPHKHPPPPFHPIVAPPPPQHPHPHPHPAPVPPSPSPSHPTVIVIVFVSLGGLLFFSMLAFALFCFIKKRKKKTRETDIIHIDEHKKVKETIFSGPFGRQTVVLSVEDDVCISEDIIKSEKLGHARGLHTNSPSAQDNPTTITNDEMVTSSSGFAHDDQHHRQLEHKP